MTEHNRLACKVCKGIGTVHHDGFTSYSGTMYADTDSPCNACQGFGWFTPPDMTDILTRIVASKGKNKGTVRASFASPAIVRNPSEAQRREQINAERAYYVWRLSRFHGGKDTTMPMTAELFSRGDPYRDNLEAIADAVAKRAFGSNMRGAGAWASALLGSEDLASFRAAHPDADPLSAFLR